MANEHMLARITRNNLIQSALRLKLLSGWDTETVKAVDSGFDAVGHGRFVFDGHTLRVESCTTDTTYTVTDHSCTCPGFGFRGTCKHQRGRALLIVAMLTGKPESYWQAEIGRCTRMPVLESRVDRLVKVSPAERAIDLDNERATDADAAAWRASVQAAVEELF